jgi:CheY-like chemotaxis protein/nitrogen-specific signal transduction histidine kinase
MAVCPSDKVMAKARKSSTGRKRRAPSRELRRWRRAGDRRAIEATLSELAHDIRTPLTGILSLGELLATSELGTRERGWAMAIKTTAEHLAMLTSLIIDAAHAGRRGLALRRERVSPRRLADVLAASLAARAETKGLACKVAIAPDLPDAVISDGLRLRAALENLIDNAVKFTDRGEVRLDAAWAKAARGQGRLVFTVTDSGIGLSAAEIKRLFRPFAQASKRIAHRYGGAGLGLAVARRIARAMGGELSVTSSARGSRFRLSAVVDLVAAAADPGGGAAEPRAGALRSLNILCAEDNPYGRVVLNTILTELGHRADFVGSGEAEVEAVAHGNYDAVLMDVTLPGLDGIAATRRIRALPGRRIKVVGVSGRGSEDEAALARDAGMDDYLPKPLSPSALASALAD